MASGVKEIYNKTAFVSRAMIESASVAVRKAALDTAAAAKSEITAQVYSTPELPGRHRTGAARASIGCRGPKLNTYGAAVSQAKSKNKQAETFEAPDISNDPQNPESIVACGVLYGANIEFGSVRKRVSVPARPFMLPAAEKVGPTFEKLCVQALGAQLRPLK